MKKGKADRDSPGCLSFVWEICWERLVVIYHFIAGNYSAFRLNHIKKRRNFFCYID